MVELQNRSMVKPPAFVIDDVLPVGLQLLYGKPKNDLSWIGLDYAYAVAGGTRYRNALGRFAVLTHGEVLYIAPSMTEEVLARRFRIFGHPPADIRITVQPPTNEPFIPWLRTELNGHPETRLVVVDTLAGIITTPYEYDAAATFSKMLAQICWWKQIAILLLVHASIALERTTDSPGWLAGTDSVVELRAPDAHQRRRGMGQLIFKGRKVDQTIDL